MTLRLCCVANPYSIHTQRWLRHFAARGHEVHLIPASPEKGTVQPGAIPPGVVYHDVMARTNVRKLRYLVWGLLTRRIVRQIRPDLLHAHQVTGPGWLAAAAGYHPFLVTAWGSDLLLGPRRSRAQNILARWVLTRADYVTCVSKGLVGAARALGADPARTEDLPWGVDTGIFHPAPDSDSRDEIRARWRLVREPVVLSLRPLRPVYNPLDVARAMPLVLERVPAALFVVRSYHPDPDLLTSFQAFVEEQGVAHAVRYVGDLAGDEEIAGLYRAADVAVSVPSSDGTPQSVLEALACGLVPVLSDIPALRDWVEHEQEGLFVPLGDPAALADAIVRLLTGTDLRARLGWNAVQLIQARADSKTGMRRYEELYKELGRRGRQSGGYTAR
ncbi:MAG TPA: glycosyltransferase family 4 protein [Anaerolineae bacterium]|nr:glycosyltransferase family 4 protein [Anaerolineae bacterium]